MSKHSCKVKIEKTKVILMSNHLQRRVGRGLPVGKLLVALSALLWLSLLICGIAYASSVNDIQGNWAAPEIEQALSTGYV